MSLKIGKHQYALLQSVIDSRNINGEQYINMKCKFRNTLASKKKKITMSHLKLQTFIGTLAIYKYILSTSKNIHTYISKAQKQTPHVLAKGYRQFLGSHDYIVESLNASRGRRQETT